MTIDITAKQSATLHLNTDKEVHVVSKHCKADISLTPGRWILSEIQRDGKYFIQFSRVG